MRARNIELKPVWTVKDGKIAIGSKYQVDWPSYGVITFTIDKETLLRMHEELILKQQ